MDGRIFLSTVEYQESYGGEGVVRVYLFDGFEWVQVAPDLSPSYWSVNGASITVVPSGEIYAVAYSYMTREVWRYNGENWENIEYVYQGAYLWPHYGILSDSSGNVYLTAFNLWPSKRG